MNAISNPASSVPLILLVKIDSELYNYVLSKMSSYTEDIAVMLLISQHKIIHSNAGLCFHLDICADFLPSPIRRKMHQTWAVIGLTTIGDIKEYFKQREENILWTTPVRINAAAATIPLLIEYYKLSPNQFTYIKRRVSTLVKRYYKLNP